MATQFVSSEAIQSFLDKVGGLDNQTGDPRLKKILRRIIGDLYSTIDEFDVSEDEFWAALNFVQAGAPEFGLWAAGLGFEHFLDERMDRKDAEAGITSGTPRTIEGPLYVAGAPIFQGEARLDDGTDDGEVLIMHGQVIDTSGKPIPEAVVDVWHANTMGNYSTFDASQSAYNLRRRIITDAEGRYKFRSIVPSGYAVPPNGTTEALLGAFGRHGHRPAHIHFFVSAPAHRHLTTQINIDGDPYLHDDFAYATRDDLIPAVVRHDEPEAIHAQGLNSAFSEIDFNFTLVPAEAAETTQASSRKRVAVAE